MAAAGRFSAPPAAESRVEIRNIDMAVGRYINTECIGQRQRPNDGSCDAP